MAVIDLVKWNGPADVLAWKFPSEELSTWSQLIVNEAQEAYLFKGGEMDGPFRPGRHTLSTDNIPVLRTLYGLPFGGKSPFTAEVWFINKMVALDLKWGTVDPVQVMDATLGVFLPVRSFGQMGLQVSDAKEFLTALVGTLPKFSHKEVAEYFRGAINTAVKTAIGALIMREKVSVFQIGAYLQEVADTAMESISREMARFGLRVVNFYVNSINVPEDDPAVARVKDAMARKAEMGILGYDYQQQRTFDTLQIAAGNEGNGMMAGAMGAGVGFGAGLPIGQTVGGLAADALGSTSPSGGLTDKVAALRELKKLLDEGVLSEDEFAAEKKLILEQRR